MFFMATEGRIRLVIDTDARRRRAVHVRAAKTGQSVSDVVNRLIDEGLSQEIAEVQDTPPPPSTTGKKRGRKRKSSSP